MEYIVRFFINTWEIYLEAAPFLFLGFAMAGILHQFMPDKFIQKYLGGKGIGPIFKAAIIGTPVPLCSCGVVPVGLSLSEKGLDRGATASFLVSTPENGVDSISLSYSLFGGFFTGVRIFFSLVVATLTGLLVHFFGSDAPTQPEPQAKGCCPSKKPNDSDSQTTRANGFSYIMQDFLPKTVKWLLLGFGLSGLISTIVPVDFFEGVGSGANIFLAAIIGVPFYVCASASTPIALSLYLTGMTPGACLVFLLTGPATNAANIPLYIKHLGTRTTGFFYAGVFGVSVLCGFVVDYMFTKEDFNVGSSPLHHHSDTNIVMLLATALFSLSLIYAIYRKYLSRFFQPTQSN